MVVVRAARGHLEPGVPLVFLHGFGSDAASWLDVMVGVGDDRDRIAVDLPGFGLHEIGPESCFTPEDHAAAAANLVREVTTRWGQPPILVGRSLGGMVAGLAAARSPEMVRAAMLISPAGIRAPRVSPFWREVEQGRNPLIPTTREEWDSMVRLVYERPRAVPAFVRREAVRHARERRDRLQAQFHSLLAEGFDPLGRCLAAIRCPLYVLWGAEDRVLDPTSLDVVRREAPGAVTELIPECGHSPTREHPKRVLHELRRVLIAYG